MITIYFTYIHSSGNKTTQPLSVFPESKNQEIEEYKQWLLESGEAKRIISVS